MSNRIPKVLLEAIQSKSGLKQAQVYRRISNEATSSFLDRPLAAIKYASSLGIPINKHATPEQLAILRESASKQDRPAPNNAQSQRPSEPNRTRQATKKRPGPREGSNPGKSVFVVHGRDEKARRAIFAFLRSIQLEPMEFEQAIVLTGKPTPYIGDVLDVAFRKCAAILVLLTPDEEAVLRSELREHPGDASTGHQPRQNVLFEAGMAMMHARDRTVLVQMGSLRPFSDVSGVHFVKLSNDTKSRQQLASKLSAAGCDVNTKGVDWHEEGDLTPTAFAK